MKNIKLLFVMMASLAIVFTSCDKDDNDDDSKSKGADYAGTWVSTINDDSFTLNEDGTGTYNADDYHNVDITLWEKTKVYNLFNEEVDGIVVNGGGMEIGSFEIKGGGDTLEMVNNPLNKFVQGVADDGADDGDTGDDTGDGDTGDELTEITGINVMSSRTGTSISFSLVDEAYGYYLFVNGEKDSDSDILSTGSPIRPETELAEGDEITIKGYEDMDATELIAEGSYTIQAADL